MIAFLRRFALRRASLVLASGRKSEEQRQRALVMERVRDMRLHLRLD